MVIVAKRGRPPKSLSELWRDGTFRWDRHRHLVKRATLDDTAAGEAVALMLADVPAYEVAGRLETTVGAVLRAMRAAGHPVTVRGNAAGSSVSAIHEWLDRHYPKASVCARCGAEGPTDYAFKYHGVKGHTRDPADYRELCKPCHRVVDANEQAVQEAIGGVREELEQAERLCASARTRLTEVEARLADRV